MKLIRGLLFVFVLSSPFSFLHNLNASEPGPMEAASGAGGMPSPELTYETIKKILDTQDIAEWKNLLETNGIKKIKDTWRRSDNRLTMLNYCWKTENKEDGKHYKKSRHLSSLVLQSMTSNEFIKDAIHAQDSVALKDAICNIFGDTYSENIFKNELEYTIAEKETEQGCPLSQEEYDREYKKLLSAFNSRMPETFEYKEALLRWSIEYPSMLPHEYILHNYGPSAQDYSKNPNMRFIFELFSSYSKSNRSFARISEGKLGRIYENINQAILLNNLELLQIFRKNYGLDLIVSAWKRYHPDDVSPALYAMHNGITNELILSELALYTNGFYTYELPERLAAPRAIRNTVEETKADVCSLTPDEDETDAELVSIQKDYTRFEKEKARTKRTNTPPMP